MARIISESLGIDTITRAYQETCREWGKIVEITKEVYWEAIGVVPPVYGKHGAEVNRFGRFWVGEEYTHDRRGNPVGLECWHDQEEQRFFCCVSAWPQTSRI